MKHRNRGLFSTGGRDGDFAEEWRDVGEMSDFSEEAANLHIRIFSRLQTPEELEYELPAIQDRCIGLFRGAYT